MGQLEKLKARLDGEDYTDALLSELLESAKFIILEQRFPFSDYPICEVLDADGDPTGEYEPYIEPRYEYLQIRIAVELFSRMGAEGQTGHSENGIIRSWSGVDVSPELLSKITPKAGVL